ncbi:hypothetical protein TCAL_03155 [Tigriopus californicus]|uniref:Uncharacterized protein n=1 Tax=Tigriopus californicus TaxID=6832 RepID=A0A553P2D8_TIGCA|nr:uncharacterized protein LOC131883221 [Tigriopus californicus]TRY71865.1 hypothetical protein TCAL_03155 [Tigriopus californicus]
MKSVVYGTAAVVATCIASAYATEEPANPMISLGMEFLARAASTSEVLTLNIPNLIGLLILKAILVGIGVFAVGGGGGINGRSDDDGFPIKQSDITGGMCFMMFTAGDLDKLSCIQRTACEDPKTASDYLTAGKMWQKLNSYMKVIPFDREYYDIMVAVQTAVDHSLKGGDCKIYHW